MRGSLVPQGRLLGSPALHAARRAKERTDCECVRGNSCRPVVLALESNGKWRNEAGEFIRLLARARAPSSSSNIYNIADRYACVGLAPTVCFQFHAPRPTPPHTVLDEEMPQFSTLLEHCPVTCPRHLASLFGPEGGPGLYFHSLSQSRDITAHGQQNLWVRHRNSSGPSVSLHLCPHPDEFLRVWRWGFQTGFA